MKTSNREGTENMKDKLLAFACVAIAPLAFAQTSVTDRSSTGEAATAARPTAQTVTVTSFTPGQSIRVSPSNIAQPVTYKLAKDVTYVDTTGKAVDPSVIGPGTLVQVEMSGQGVDRVTVVQPR
jgi:hypothetical protein